jgi:hypothetical protein
VHARERHREPARGRESVVTARGPNGRRVVVRYSPLLAHPHIATPQRPDVMLTIHDRDWPPLHLILDAKYRLDDSPERVRRDGAPGPPDDALNVLHRYRDAILERPDAAATRPKRGVVQAAAAFPHRDPPGQDYASSRLYRSLDAVGVGAIPLLPGATHLLERWLTRALSRGSWSLSETAPGHTAEERAAAFRRAAAEPALIGALRGQDPEGHLAWVTSARMYYAPLTTAQQRQFVARWIALYMPGSPGAITHEAEVMRVEVKRRGEVQTPWQATRSPDETVLVYHLVEVTARAQPIVNRDGRRVPARLWSSHLGLCRAEELGQLALETEPEWRLFEELSARGIAFHIAPAPAQVEDAEDPRGRARFRGKEWSARYRGAAGFQVVSGGATRWVARPEEVVAAVARG